jgi:hypothetical protein
MMKAGVLSLSLSFLLFSFLHFPLFWPDADVRARIVQATWAGRV